MYPVLFRFGGFRLDTYDVVWLLALSLAVSWSVRRFRLYGVDDGEARRVIGWSFLAMLLGANLFKPVARIIFWLVSPSSGAPLFLEFDRNAPVSSVLNILRNGGLSELGAVSGAFITAFCLCLRSKKISFQRLCDVAALPAMLTIAVGRWGCFLNGCCVGIVSSSFPALHFPQDPAGVLRHPTQLYYSFAAAAGLLFLIPAERALLRRDPVELLQTDRPYHAVLAPLTLIVYTLMRLAVDTLRRPETNGLPLFPLTHWLLCVALPLECVWLVWSVRARLKNKIQRRDSGEHARLKTP